ncbi:kinetochore-associated Ndc80 complex subunit ndc80 [Collariella sp. IMI 366227]|nr:kinetochore-associated Ndc80 complex subunit ndc80 [Collariella sp. IMI 366227]
MARSVSGPRQSLAMGRPSQPMFNRPSSGLGLADTGLSSVKRASIAPYGSNAAKQYPGAGPSARDDRRSSVYHARPSTVGPMGGGSQSFFQQAPQAAGVPRDPRPLKDRSYQTRLGQELLDYLAKNNFEMEMNHKLSDNFTKSPTQKDFNYLFQWLYHRIDPSYRFQKNIDQEVPPLLKQLRYPYERSITKSQIAAVGGQNWSTFLGLLHWMMQLAQMLEGYSHREYDEACFEAGVDVAKDNVVFDFLTNAYQDWLNVDEDLPEEEAGKALEPHVQEMARAFERSNAKIWKIPPPDAALLDKHFKIMEDDRAKFEEFNTLAAQRSEKHEGRIKILQEELDKLQGELKEAEDERRRLQKAVDDQGISMQDIDRMTAERERLQKSIELTSQRLEDTKRKATEREMEASERLDELERMVDRYNTVAYQIGLIPSAALLSATPPPNFTSSQLQSSYTPTTDTSDRLLADPVTGYQPTHILNLDLRGQVKNHLAALRKEVSERRKAALDAMMEDHDLLDRAKEAIEDKRGEVEALEHRVRAAEEEYERTKEVTTAQKLASDVQIEKMEKELAKMRAQLTESVQLMEQREMNTNIEYEQLTLRANALREELHTETMRMLNDVIKFKMHVQKSLEEYESFVADELEKELGSDEMRDDTQAMEM